MGGKLIVGFKTRQCPGSQRNAQGKWSNNSAYIATDSFRWADIRCMLCLQLAAILDHGQTKLEAFTHYQDQQKGQA